MGKNGAFRHYKNEFYMATVPATDIGFLPEIKKEAKLNVPKMKYSQLMQVQNFFRAVYKRCKSEVAVILYAKPIVRSEDPAARDSGGWRIRVPKQEVSGTSVHYKLDDPSMPCPPEIEDGYRMFGTIHSHAGMGAFHSSVDDKDEFGFDGLHITIGNFNLQDQSYAARWILGGAVFQVPELDGVIDYPNFQAEEEDDWLSRVSESRPSTVVYSGAGYHHNHVHHGHHSHSGGSGAPSTFQGDRHFRQYENNLSEGGRVGSGGTALPHQETKEKAQEASRQPATPSGQQVGVESVKRFFTVADGERLTFWRTLSENEKDLISDQVVRLGKQEMADFCRAVGSNPSGQSSTTGASAPKKENSVAPFPATPPAPLTVGGAVTKAVEQVVSGADNATVSQTPRVMEHKPEWMP